MDICHSEIAISWRKTVSGSLWSCFANIAHYITLVCAPYPHKQIPKYVYAYAKKTHKDAVLGLFFGAQRVSARLWRGEHISHTFLKAFFEVLLQERPRPPVPFRGCVPWVVGSSGHGGLSAIREEHRSGHLADDHEFTKAEPKPELPFSHLDTVSFMRGDVQTQNRIPQTSWVIFKRHWQGTKKLKNKSIYGGKLTEKRFY